MPSERKQCGQLSVVKLFLLGSGLEFDKFAGTGHDDVHVDLGGGILFVAEIQQAFAIQDADAGGGDIFANGVGAENAAFDESADGEAEGDEGAGDGGGARAAIGLQDVAIEDDGAFTERPEVDDAA